MMPSYLPPKINYFRTRLWYAEVLYRSEQANPKQLERLFKPDKKPLDQSNSWYQYRKGERTPSLKTLRMVEQRFPGSYIIFNHVLWDILRLANPYDETALTAVLIRLKQWCRDILIRQKSPLKFSKLIARELVKRDDLDALALLLLFWNNAHLRGSAKNTRLAARFVYYFLFMSDFRFLHDEANGTLLFDALSELVLNHSMRDSERAKNTHEIWYKNRALLRANADSVTYSCFISEVFDRRNALYRTLKKPSQLDGDFQDIS